MQKLLIAAAVSVAALTGVAAAQAPGGGRMGMLEQADTNHDGTITRAEFDAARAAYFTQLDANHDGKLQASEQPHWGPPGGAPPAGGAPPGGHDGMRGDANGDGVVTRAEYDAQSAHMFDRLDADHNGSISQAEIQAMRSHLQAHQGQ